MQVTRIHLVDDVDGSEAVEKVIFGIDGSTYEIDLSRAHVVALRADLAPWVSAARRAGAAPPVRVHQTLAPQGASKSALIRAWAAGHGHKVPARGRIPAAVVAAWEAEQ